MKKVWVTLFALALAACGDIELRSEWSAGTTGPFGDADPRSIDPNDGDPDPGSTPTTPGTQTLVVNEAFFRVEGVPGDASRDGVSLPNDQFLEIRNVTNAPLSLEGVEIWEGQESEPRVSFDFPVTLGAGRALLIFGGGPALTTGDVTCGVGTLVTSRDLRLDRNDTVRLVLGGEILDEVSWADAPPNVSLTRAADGTGPLGEHLPVADRTGAVHQWSPGCQNDGTTDF